MPLLDEPLLSLNEARRLVPGRGSSHPTARTVRAWIRSGIHTRLGRIRLEGQAVGGVWRTSAAALARFAERVSEAKCEPVAAGPVRTPTQRQRDSDAATAALKAAGW